MRVVCESFDDFLENLNIDEDQNLFEDTIRVSISMKKESECVTKVSFICSILVQTNEAEYLVEYGEFSGYDYSDGPANGPSGSTVAAEKKQRLSDIAATRSWRVRPGVIGV